MSTAVSAESQMRGRRRSRARYLATGCVAAAAALVSVLGLAGSAAASPSMQTTGSSFAGLAIQEWVGQAATLYGLSINWQVSSSVIGLNNFAQNQVDFAASDIPYSAGQTQSNPTIPYEYMPDVAGALAFMYNLNGNNGAQITNLVLDAPVVDNIFSGRITNWTDPSIEALNPQLAGDLPNTTIIPVYRTDASGENYLLTDYLLHQDHANFLKYQNDMSAQQPGSPSANWPTPPDLGHIPPGYPGWTAGSPVAQSGSDNVANYVSAASSNGAVGYVETAYAKVHNEPVASMVNASGNAVQPTSLNDATALEKAVLNADLTQELANVYSNPLPNAYPISAYSYLVTPCSPSLAAAQHPPTNCSGSGTPTFPADKGQALGQFIGFLACAGQEKMALLGYSPLPPNLVQEDFNAIGRLNGGQQPLPPTAANCKNPYVDGEVPLPGEPIITGQAPGTPGATQPGSGPKSANPTRPGAGAGPTVSSTGGSVVGGSAGSSTSGLASTAVNGESGASRYLQHVGKAGKGSTAFQRADALQLAVAGALRGSLPAKDIVIWCLVLAGAIGVPFFVLWLRRRAKRRREVRLELSATNQRRLAHALVSQTWETQ